MAAYPGIIRLLVVIVNHGSAQRQMTSGRLTGSDDLVAVNVQSWGVSPHPSNRRFCVHDTFDGAYGLMRSDSIFNGQTIFCRERDDAHPGVSFTRRKKLAGGTKGPPSSMKEDDRGIVLPLKRPVRVKDVQFECDWADCFIDFLNMPNGWLGSNLISALMKASLIGGRSQSR